MWNISGRARESGLSRGPCWLSAALFGSVYDGLPMSPNLESTQLGELGEEESLLQSFFGVNTVSDTVVRHLLDYLSVQKWFVGDIPFYVEIWPKLPHPFKNSDFQSVFVRSVSAVTPSEKKFN